MQSIQHSLRQMRWIQLRDKHKAVKNLKIKVFEGFLFLPFVGCIKIFCGKIFKQHIAFILILL